MGSALIDDRSVANALVTWFGAHGRQFPWRSDRPDAWTVLVSEILLQQTQTATVAPRFAEIMATIPTAKHCAELSDAQLRWLWDGLGYYRRAEHLRSAAQTIQRRFRGYVPRTPELLAELPGVGPYTLGAVCAIAFNLPVAGVDGNIARVFARLHGVIDTPSALKPQAETWLPRLYLYGSPRIVMQAIMDIGATICTPRAANCAVCPLKRHCVATSWQDPASTPLTAKRKTQPAYDVVHAWICDDKHYFFSWRPAGLLGNCPAPMLLEQAEAPTEIRDDHGVAKRIELLPTFRHTFTHLRWNVQPAIYRWHGNRVPSFADRPDTIVPIEAIEKFGLPAAFRKGTPQGRQLSLTLPE